MADQDTIGGSVGADSRNNIVGKGVQSVTLNLGEMSSREVADLLNRLPRVTDIVLGDGMRWEGVVQEIRKLELQIQKLAEQMTLMQQRLTSMEHKLGEQPTDSSPLSNWLQRLLIAFVIIASGAQLWQIWPK